MGIVAWAVLLGIALSGLATGLFLTACFAAKRGEVAQ